MVVSVCGNAGTRSQQARLREASASKPPMNCRKRIRRCQNRGLTLYGAFDVKDIPEGALLFRASFFVRLGSRFFAPTGSTLQAARAGAVKAGRRSMLAARSRVARPRLDGFERDGRLGAVGTTVGVELASGADQSRHNLVFGGPEDPNHDAAMRIGREAPKRRTHSTSRH